MKHTTGIMRAAEKIIFAFHIQSQNYQARVLEVADIIAEETAQPKLLDAAKDGLYYLHTGYMPDRGIVRNLRSAIKRAEGGK